MDGRSPTPRLLVTGAAGFIGAAVSPSLADAFGAVRAGVRRARPDFPPAVEAIACDLDDPRQIAAAVQGVDLVVHAAYGDEAAMPRQAENLLGAMSEAGIRNLVAFSSIAIYGERPGWVEESDGPVEPLSLYAESKAQCERLYRLWSAADSARRVIALRPGIVYGPGSHFWIEKMAARICSGGWGLLGPRGEGRAALIHVEDLARQTRAASQILTGPERQSLRGFTALNAVGPENPSWNVYFAAMARALGQPPLRIWSPMEIAARQALAIPAKITQRLRLPMGRAAALAPTPGEMALFRLDADYSGAAAERLFGFAPAIGMAEGLKRCGLNATAGGRPNML